MTAPVLPKTISKKRREWLRGLKVGDQVALWDGISWSDARCTEETTTRRIYVQAVSHYPWTWVSRGKGYSVLGESVSILYYIGRIEDHAREVEVSESRRELANVAHRFNELTDDAIVEAAKILRAGKRAS